MTDKVTELAKKHGAKFTVASNGDTYQVQNRVSMTPAQLRAIIKEASAPLVEGLKSVQSELWMYGYQDDSRDRVQVTLRDTLAEFNKEFGDD